MCTSQMLQSEKITFQGHSRSLGRSNRTIYIWNYLFLKPNNHITKNQLQHQHSNMKTLKIVAFYMFSTHKK